MKARLAEMQSRLGAVTEAGENKAETAGEETQVPSSAAAAPMDTLMEEAAPTEAGEEVPDSAAAAPVDPEDVADPQMEASAASTTVAPPVTEAGEKKGKIIILT